MQKDHIFQIINDWNIWNKDINVGIHRKEYLSRAKEIMSGNQILAILGPRRAGKSYLMRQIASDLVVQNSVDKKQILMVNFEDPRFSDLDSDLLQEIFETYLEFVRPVGLLYIFLDEIQEVKNWEKWVRTIHELGKAKIIISGSNAKLLSQELATVLTGRHLDITVWPLSFKEFLLFRNISVDNKNDYLAKETDVKIAWREYTELGGFPEVVKDPAEKSELLLSYFDDLMEKDLVRRYRVRKEGKIKELARYYFSNIAKLATNTSAGKFLNLSTDTVDKFNQYFATAYLLLFVKRWSFKFKEQEKSPRKVYAVDTGMSKVIGFEFGDNYGRYLENMVFIELMRRKMCVPDQELYYWKDSQQHEVDIVVKEKKSIKYLIQVVWELSNEKTKLREKKSLLKAMDEFGLSVGVIITGSESGVEVIGDKKIVSVPVFIWALFGFESVMTTITN